MSTSTATPSSVTFTAPGPGEGCEPKTAINPVHKEFPIHLAHLSARCGARTRRGTPCLSPAVSGRKSCRMHGGTSPGAPKGEANGNFRTGRDEGDSVAEMRQARRLLKAWADLARES
jgi:hypothetical protein